MTNRSALTSPGQSGGLRLHRSQTHPWIISVAVMLRTFMEMLETTIVNVQVSHVAGNLSAMVGEATRALTP